MGDFHYQGEPHHFAIAFLNILSGMLSLNNQGSSQEGGHLHFLSVTLLYILSFYATMVGRRSCRGMDQMEQGSEGVVGGVFVFEL